MTTGPRLLLAAMECPKGDIAGNLARHRAVLDEAAAGGCDVVLFPEMSLTGSVDPATHPDRLIGLGHRAVSTLVAASADAGVACCFGVAERDETTGAAFISQVAAARGGVVAVQRKRHLGEGETAYGAGTATAVFPLGDRTAGMAICAEHQVCHPWDAVAAAGASVVLFAAAPGLDARCTGDAAWRAGLDWWESAGLADAADHAARLGVWVAMATQAGTTTDEDFPGLAALIDPGGRIVARTPDWRPATVVVEVPAG